ncbi:universal stress protein UspA [Pseudomonas agarici]|uniref:Universal stress protein UspA n=1 Tax=Pseudomonas agarici TaxID=46677 RepID=A0A0X1T797_PSEAA|nr:universal stress protein [Pseudomonas agarici]AMB87843.1 universal stress protein UspA [Pseudomonas agarici]NWB92766.1 universal stress protein [Pseudomonas agarici]NWC09033.1 universal stress protein [Pseudomonas agarici]SEK36642.1 Nucleotide-binding universal stress protein, UspA family [Pseudomonas agarici]
MQAIRSILVILDPEHAHSLALNRAKLIAKVTDAHLHLLMCDPRHDHSALLALLKSQLHDDGYSATAEQAWEKTPHDTIIGVQQAEGCALVIKQHRPDSSLKKALLTPSDWQLLRFCPCAVLMVKTEVPWAGGVILAAVDVGNADEEHRHLHASIIDHGYDIASLAKGRLHVMTAHPSPMLSAADPVYQLKETIEARYREQCRAFQTEFDIDDDHLHIAEGPADVLIPHMAHKLDAAVTVIGTVARTGISGALIGNTAEAVLDSLESDILVLKPQEIIDHLEELARG